MPTKKPILNFAVDQELFDRIDDYRFRHRIYTRSDAIRKLLEDSLKRDQEPEEKRSKTKK